jgi:hypothetical protein
LVFFGILVPEDWGCCKVLEQADKKGLVNLSMKSFFSGQGWRDISIKSNGYMVRVARSVVYSPNGTSGFNKW